jgi:hypothetical protein
MTAIRALRQVLEAEASISRLQSEVSQRVVDLGFTLQEEFVDERVFFIIVVGVCSSSCCCCCLEGRGRKGIPANARMYTRARMPTQKIS